MEKNIHWHNKQIKRKDRLNNLKQKNNKVIWFTGLSGSGKSTLANYLEVKLNELGYLTYSLDGDNIRHGINSDLGFSQKDRSENIRRISEITKLFYQSGAYTLVSFISPYKKDRNYARKLIGDDFIEIYVSTSLKECERRDTKGLYKKARNGEIKDFTGISAPYEKPKNPEITLDTKDKSIKECVNIIIDYLENGNR